MTNSYTPIFDTKRYFTSLLLLLLGLTVATVGISVLAKMYFCWIWSVPCYFLLLGVGLYFAMSRFLVRISEKLFVNSYMLVLFTKMFISIIAIVLYLFLVREQSVALVVAFFIYYIVFSVFETKFLLRTTKKRDVGER